LIDARSMLGEDSSSATSTVSSLSDAARRESTTTLGGEGLAAGTGGVPRSKDWGFARGTPHIGVGVVLRAPGGGAAAGAGTAGAPSTDDQATVELRPGTGDGVGVPDALGFGGVAGALDTAQGAGVSVIGRG
jgi:hypothetical protein